MTYPKWFFTIISGNGSKLLFLRQFWTDWPEIKTGCSPICILCVWYIKQNLMTLFQFGVFGILRGFLKVIQLQQLQNAIEYIYTAHTPALILSTDVQKTLCNSVNIPLNGSCCIKLDPNPMFMASSSMQQLSFSGIFTKLYNVFFCICKEYQGRCMYSINLFYYILQLLELHDLQKFPQEAKKTKLKQSHKILFDVPDTENTHRETPSFNFRPIRPELTEKQRFETIARNDREKPFWVSHVKNTVTNCLALDVSVVKMCFFKCYVTD